MFWKRGPVEDEFLRVARTLPKDTQKEIFEPTFLLHVVNEVRTSYDPQIVPRVEDLKQGRCNYPPELTKRTYLWRSRGKARCKKSVKDGVFFCHLLRHRQFADMHNLPLDWKERGDKVLLPKPQEERRGWKVDDDPLKPTCRANGIKRKLVTSDVISAIEPAGPRDAPVVDTVTNRLQQLQQKRRKIAASEMSSGDEFPSGPAKVDPQNQCVFTDPLSGNGCLQTGVHEDFDNHLLRFCPLHVTVPADLLETARHSRDHALYRDLQQISLLDAELEETAANANASDVNRKQLCLRRVLLANKYGIGTLPHLIDLARS